MEDTGSDQPKARRYGLRSRGNVNQEHPGDDERVAGAASKVLSDQTARVCNAPKISKKAPANTRNTRATRAARKKTVVQDDNENIVTVQEDNKAAKGEVELANPIENEVKEDDIVAVPDDTEQIQSEKETKRKENISPTASRTTKSVREEKLTPGELPHEPRKAEKDQRSVPEEKSDSKKSFFELPVTEQLYIVRKKLEKIIHKKETNQDKALDLLRIIERTKITEQLLEDSKIDLTLEALKFVIKDEHIVKKTDHVLRSLKKLKKKKEAPIVDKKWRKKNDESGSVASSQSTQTSSDKKTVSTNSNSNSNSTLHWMDKMMEDSSRKMEQLNKKLDTLKSGVKDIQPAEREKEKSDTKQSERLKDDENEMIKILDSLNALSVDDDTGYRLLKDLSYLRYNEKMCKNPSLDTTLRKYCKSSIAKTKKIAGKILEKIESIRKAKSAVDTITDSIVQLKIKEKDDSKKTENKKFDSDIEVIKVSKTVEGISLKEIKSAELFTKPNKVHSAKPTIVKEEKPIEVDQDSLMARLKKLELENKIHKIKIKLDDYTAKDNKDELSQLLKDLEKSELTLELLETTRIGLSLNSFRKRVEDKDIAKLGKDIIRKWKSLIPDEKKSQAEKDEEETEEEKQKRTLANTERVRSHCRGLLLSALTEDITVPDTVDTDKLAAGIEEAIFERFKTTSQKYRSQVHSRQFNIRSNVTLKENLLVGNISPDEVAVMTHEDMANDDLKKMREDLKAAGFDCLPSSHVEGDKFCTCRICLPPWVQQ